MRDMTSINLRIFSIVALTVIIFVNTYAYQISLDNNAVDYETLNEAEHLQFRTKRQLESFDDYPPNQDTGNQDGQEPSFWDRIVKVALKLVSKFIEWLNSS